MNIKCAYCDYLFFSDVDHNISKGEFYFYPTCPTCKQEMKVTVIPSPQFKQYVEPVTEEEDTNDPNFDLHHDLLVENFEHEFSEDDVEYAELIGIDLGFEDTTDYKSQEPISYNDLLDKFNHSGDIPYIELLKTKEWVSFRNQVVARDKNNCQHCDCSDGTNQIMQDKVFNLQVHHKYYIHGALPWDYPLTDLITLCNHCHEAYHKTNSVKVYTRKNGRLEVPNFVVCDRCGGRGKLMEYKHVSDGICFKCDGRSYFLID